jgi:hypothetical protein
MSYVPDPEADGIHPIRAELAAVAAAMDWPSVRFESPTSGLPVVLLGDESPWRTFLRRASRPERLAAFEELERIEGERLADRSAADRAVTQPDLLQEAPA